MEKGAGSKPPKILIIEDDNVLAKMYSEKFRLEGFSVTVSYDGEDGFNKIKEVAPEIILLDIMLPKMPGMSLLQKIKDDPQIAHIPVVALTNLTEKDEAEKARRLGVIDYLAKAMHSPSEVVQKVKEAIKITSFQNNTDSTQP